MADDENQGQEESVRVFVRIRPLNRRELAEKQTIGWNFNETSMLEDTPNGQKSYVVSLSRLYCLVFALILYFTDSTIIASAQLTIT